MEMRSGKVLRRSASMTVGAALTSASSGAGEDTRTVVSMGDVPVRAASAAAVGATGASPSRWASNASLRSTRSRAEEHDQLCDERDVLELQELRVRQRLVERRLQRLNDDEEVGAGPSRVAGSRPEKVREPAGAAAEEPQSDLSRCLGVGHRRPRCKAEACDVNGCGRFHHKLLHRQADGGSSKVLHVDDGCVATNTDSAKVMHASVGEALLKVLPVVLSGPSGSVKTYALLDDGATVSLLDEATADRIGANGSRSKLDITGIHGCKSVISQTVSFKVRGVEQPEEYVMSARTVPALNLAPQTLKEKSLIYNHLLDLALPSYSDAQPTLLIGQDNVGLLLASEVRRGKSSEPVASRTLLGWVLHGHIADLTKVGHAHVVLNVRASAVDSELADLVKRSYALDSIGVSTTPRVSSVEQRAVDIVEKTARLTEEGRWETGLPWVSDDVSFPDNRVDALRRLYYIERRCRRDKDFEVTYSAQVENFLKQGYAEECHGPGVAGKKWYLPHFPVVNPQKPGKVRLVFDAAARTHGLALNDMLLTGPPLLASLLGVLFRFRQGEVAVTADIKEMFLRVIIREEDRDFQRFLWRPSARRGEASVAGEQRGAGVTEYRMKSMIFGAASSPFIALYIKNKNAAPLIDENRRAYDCIVNNHYMDDLVDSFHSVLEATEVTAAVAATHKRGGFELRAWASNKPEVIQQFPRELHADSGATVSLGDGEGQTQKILGVMWRPNDDTLGFNTRAPRVSPAVISGLEKPTKRQLLCLVMSLYDPLGLVSPFTIFGKILLQDVWRADIGWDEVLHDDQARRFALWLKLLQDYSQLSIPRCYALSALVSVAELHTFCDASEQAYAAVCYWRFTSPTISCSLIVAKARVAPLRPVSIPRLELQAAVLGARLARTVVEEHSIKVGRRFFWSDSATVLAWIRSDARRYKAFVANRLGEIDELSGSEHWRWVPTKQNPADLATRDYPSVVARESEWFTAPRFLYEPESEWPQFPSVELKLPAEEFKEVVHVTTAKEHSLPLPEVARFSKWSRLINATAYVLLFVDKLRKRGSASSSLTVELKQKAERLWVECVQRQCYPREYACLKANKPIPTDSSLLEVSPYLDEHGLMRVRGRIDVVNVPMEVKRPIILGKHAYTDLFLYYYHVKYGHGSTETVLNEVRQIYYIPKLRSRLRFIAYRCAFCRVRRARPLPPPVGDLPIERVDYGKRPFTHCGLDYFGPLFVTIGRRREKRYICLFTCLVSRAVHLEVAASLSCDSALLALRRLAARRGSPVTIYSDNGTNFHAADKELKEAWLAMNQDEMVRQALAQQIQWKFIPAGAPHMGGAWERLVQSVKRVLRVTLRDRAPKEEVLHTLVVEAEAVVNSRPLTHVSPDPADPEALTPNHFLLGSSSGRVTTPGVFADCDLLSRRDWRVAQRLADHFWMRWVREYLPQLRRREGNTANNHDLKIGDWVVVADQRLPRNCWPQGTVTSVFPGRDGRVRVVDFKCSRVTNKRKEFNPSQS